MALCIMSKCGCVCVWNGAGGQVGFKIGYEIPKNVGMTMASSKGEGWCSSS